MYNSLVFTSGLTVWITQAEVDAINASLTNGDKFVSVPRLQQTFNTTTFSWVGINPIFNDPKVKGSDFKFTPTSVVAKNIDKEFLYQGQGWKPARNQYDDALSFDDLIALQTV